MGNCMVSRFRCKATLTTVHMQCIHACDTNKYIIIHAYTCIFNTVEINHRDGPVSHKNVFVYVLSLLYEQLSYLLFTCVEEFRYVYRPVSKLIVIRLERQYQ